MKKLVESLAVVTVLALSALSVNLTETQFTQTEQEQAVNQQIDQGILMAGGGDEWTGG